MKQNFYESQIAKIKSLMTKGDYQAASKVLAKEMTMPYIPLAYEQRFKDLKRVIKHQLATMRPPKQLALSEVMEMLWASEKKQVNALSLLSSYHLRPVKNELKKRIESWNDNYKQAFLYEVLAEQAIDLEVKVNGTVLNPSTFSIFKGKEVQVALHEIRELSFKSPQLETLATNELYRYLLSIFPHLNFKGKVLGKMIFNIIEGMFMPSKKLSLAEQRIKKVLSRSSK